MRSRGFCENALELCAPLKCLWADVKAGTWKLFCLKNKIFLVEEKRTCFQLKIGLSTEAASFLVALRLLPRRLPQTMC